VLDALLKFLIFLLLTLGGITLALLSMENQLIFFPSVEGDWERPSRSGGTIEDVEITTSDRVKLQAWYFPAKGASLSILFFHGNAGNLSHRGDWAEEIGRLGVNVLLLDYRGYGLSQGEPDEAGIYLDAEAAYRYLTEIRDVPPEQVVVYGVSLGGAAACEVAVRHPCKALILQSVFSSAPDMAGAMYPFLPARWLVRTQFLNHKKLSQIEAPKLILHSTADEVIPVWMAQKNFEGARDPKRLEIFSGGEGHNDLVVRQGERLREIFRDFLGIAEP
jgi:fermentation-respiration switch protein FrsA (DUF1100 family)